MFGTKKKREILHAQICSSIPKHSIIEQKDFILKKLKLYGILQKYTAKKVSLFIFKKQQEAFKLLTVQTSQ
jgi:hypothetical protein